MTGSTVNLLDSLNDDTLFSATRGLSKDEFGGVADNWSLLLESTFWFVLRPFLHKSLLFSNTSESGRNSNMHCVFRSRNRVERLLAKG